MSARLDSLVQATRDAVAGRKRARPLAELERDGTRGGSSRPFREALARPGTSVIAEFKRRSPSAGEIRPGADVAKVVSAYERGGAAALSVLTEERHFGGSLDDVKAARAAGALPILRKDFTIDPYQLHEARIAGADAVLIVVGALDTAAAAELHAAARELDLDALVEVYDERELDAALSFDAEVIGINNRNLEDFSVDLGRTMSLLPDVPAGKTVVSESGIVTRAHVEGLEAVGVDAVLVGETVMRAEDQEAAVRELSQADQPAP